MVGEIRDNETAELAIHAGLTGHFVLSSVHTKDALSVVPRLLDMKVEPFLLGSTLDTVVAQRLARKICPHCKIEEVVPENILADIREEIKKIPEDMKEALPALDANKLIFYKGKGCPRCGNLGYNDRIALVEVVDVNDKLKEEIINFGKKGAFTLENILANQKFITMKQDGIIKALQGATSMEEVLRVIYE
jgi:type IV pilus assembly protein PilB